jgi:hypothetical protein
LLNILESTGFRGDTLAVLEAINKATERKNSIQAVTTNRLAQFHIVSNLDAPPPPKQNHQHSSRRYYEKFARFYIASNLTSVSELTSKTKFAVLKRRQTTVTENHSAHSALQPEEKLRFANNQKKLVHQQRNLKPGKNSMQFYNVLERSLISKNIHKQNCTTRVRLFTIKIVNKRRVINRQQWLKPWSQS